MTKNTKPLCLYYGNSSTIGDERGVEMLSSVTKAAVGCLARVFSVTHYTDLGVQLQREFRPVQLLPGVRWAPYAGLTPYHVDAFHEIAAGVVFPNVDDSRALPHLPAEIAVPLPQGSSAEGGSLKLSAKESVELYAATERRVQPRAANPRRPLNTALTSPLHGGGSPHLFVSFDVGRKLAGLTAEAAAERWPSCRMDVSKPFRFQSKEQQATGAKKMDTQTHEHGILVSLSSDGKKAELRPYTARSLAGKRGIAQAALPAAAADPGRTIEKKQRFLKQPAHHVASALQLSNRYEVLMQNLATDGVVTAFAENVAVSRFMQCEKRGLPQGKHATETGVYYIKEKERADARASEASASTSGAKATPAKKEAKVFTSTANLKRAPGSDDSARCVEFFGINGLAAAFKESMTERHQASTALSKAVPARMAVEIERNQQRKRELLGRRREDEIIAPEMDATIDTGYEQLAKLHDFTSFPVVASTRYSAGPVIPSFREVQQWVTSRFSSMTSSSSGASPLGPPPSVELNAKAVAAFLKLPLLGERVSRGGDPLADFLTEKERLKMVEVFVWAELLTRYTLQDILKNRHNYTFNELKLLITFKLLGQRDRGIVAIFGGLLMDLVVVRDDNSRRDVNDIDVAVKNFNVAFDLANELRETLHGVDGVDVSFKRERSGRPRYTVTITLSSDGLFEDDKVINIDLCDSSGERSEGEHDTGSIASWRENPGSYRRTHNPNLV